MIISYSIGVKRPRAGGVVGGTCLDRAGRCRCGSRHGSPSGVGRRRRCLERRRAPSRRCRQRSRHGPSSRPCRAGRGPGGSYWTGTDHARLPRGHLDRRHHEAHALVEPRRQHPVPRTGMPNLRSWFRCPVTQPVRDAQPPGQPAGVTPCCAPGATCQCQRARLKALGRIGEELPGLNDEVRRLGRRRFTTHGVRRDEAWIHRPMT